MKSFAELLIGAAFLRPYVVAFFFTYLLGCSLHLGVKRALLFGIAGYLIAWLSEYSSIHNGIPYGYYYYIDHTRNRELWVLGVPLMDSASYVFLSYASYSTALMVVSPVMRTALGLYSLETRRIRHSLLTRFLGALFFVYLDIIIDPVALQGHRWFLGRLYGYPEHGVYFGVPLSNFIGWFIVGFLMIAALQRIDALLFKRRVRDYYGASCSRRYLIGPLLYIGVIIFNLAMTFSIGEHTMGWVGVFIVLMPSVLIWAITAMKLSSATIPHALEAHRRDFPEAVIGDE